MYINYIYISTLIYLPYIYIYKTLKVIRGVRLDNRNFERIS